jgi:hypothetical protein
MAVSMFRTKNSLVHPGGPTWIQKDRLSVEEGFTIRGMRGSGQSFSEADFVAEARRALRRGCPWRGANLTFCAHDESPAQSEMEGSS